MKRLKCHVQHYQWGKRGQSSAVAALMKELIEEDEFYAELWVGTHPNGPSEVIAPNGEQETTLKEFITQHPDYLGRHEEGDLKFLFKVLSVAKALSVQSHPTKEQAKILHAKDPTNYPDDNHKPEMAIALTDFELLCGFQKAHGILSNIKAHKELLELIGEENLVELAEDHGEVEQKAALKKIFIQVWNSSEERIRKAVEEITGRLLLNSEERTPVDELVLRLNEQFPQDIGVLAPFFLNYFTLKPGQAVFFLPNELHAYLSGDCVECMALSDNTIRAGLTPKFKDIATMCENLAYNMCDPPIFKPVELPNGVTEYSPPVKEFAVHKISKDVTTLEPIAAASILIVIAGEASIKIEDEPEMIHKGDVLFLPQRLKGAIKAKQGDDEFVAFRAFNPPN